MAGVIALCSVGSLGKYLCDELLAAGRQFVVISRQSNKGAFFEQRNIRVRTSDYSAASVLAILDDTNAGALVSFNNSDGQTYVDVHCAFLEACRRSRSCRRFIPAEFAGNVDDFPLLPSYFQTSRVPFRRILERETGVEWTVFNNGWLMDYLLTRDKTYMPWIPNEFPIDPNNWTACIRGTGDQVQSFTSARDVARALIMLLDAPEWASFLSFWLLMRSDTVKERTTYITGQWSTFNDMVRFMEAFHGPSTPPRPDSADKARPPDGQDVQVGAGHTARQRAAPYGGERGGALSGERGGDDGDGVGGVPARQDASSTGQVL
ncbi:NmrA-like protein [Ophiocordyceps sinensis CO18]|uniref:NmrA-like protein n=1 Tax=Ophiocordyceps sinensis (strain Co18 / CGMCC 3.14243) TaxID=911162 RepID=T5ACY4_OPHSC|nr:NmrA-like protein [Ophiocordyceps sinensis CO18]